MKEPDIYRRQREMLAPYLAMENPPPRVKTPLEPPPFFSIAMPSESALSRRIAKVHVFELGLLNGKPFYFYKGLETE